MGYRLAYIRLTLTHYNGQDQGHAYTVKVLKTQAC